ncbi:MAG TPA: DNA modification methylase [Bacteroidales bacterium]|nr:DNA modification methylase [Bacteroidales bacterium]
MKKTKNRKTRRTNRKQNIGGNPTMVVKTTDNHQINHTTGIFDVDINQIKPHPMVMEVYKEKKLSGLILMMKLVGYLLNPIKVVLRDGGYLIFDGISRYMSACQLGWEKISIEVYEYTDEEIPMKRTFWNCSPKRSLLELCHQAEQVLGILGKSQGKKREQIGDLSMGDEDFCLAGKDRFQIACEIIGCDFSSITLRRLLEVKEFEENNPDVSKTLGLMEKLEHGIIKIHQAFNYMEIYKEAKREQGENALTEALRVVNGENYTIVNESCENLGVVPNDSINCVLTSCPYYQMRTYPDGVRDVEQIQHGQEQTVDEYIQKEVEIYSGVYPKLKETGSLFIVIGDSFDGKVDCAVVEKLVVGMLDYGWYLVQKIIWKKKNPKPVGENMRRLLPNYETILWFCKNPDTYYYREFKMWKEGNYEIKPSNVNDRVVPKHSNKVFTIKKPLERFRSFLNEQTVENEITSSGFNWSELKEINPHYRHKAPYSYIIPILPILMTTKIGDTVLDIFNGTGTTCAVACALGRKSIGYDTDTSSHQFAAKRLKMVEENRPTTDEITEFENDYMEEAA